MGNEFFIARPTKKDCVGGCSAVPIKGHGKQREKERGGD